MRRIMTFLISFFIVIMCLEACVKNEGNNSSHIDELSASTGVSEIKADLQMDEESALLETDMDIILRTGHPTYYGSVEQSHEVWDDVEDGKIQFADKFYGHGETPILAMEAYRNSDLIRQVVINFAYFEEKPKVSLDESIEIVASFMPYEIMDQYYEYAGSKLIVADEEDDNGTYYVISYRLTDSAKKEKHDYSGSIDVILQADKDTVINAVIGFGTPRWMSSLELNGYHAEEWTCDLYDNRQ